MALPRGVLAAALAWAILLTVPQRARMDRLVQPFIIVSGLAVAGFVMSLGWTKGFGSGWEPGKIVFLVTVWGSIGLGGPLLVLVALS